MRPHIKQPWANKSLLAANLRGRHKWGGKWRDLSSPKLPPPLHFSPIFSLPLPPPPPPWLLHATQTIF